MDNENKSKTIQSTIPLFHHSSSLVHCFFHYTILAKRARPVKARSHYQLNNLNIYTLPLKSGTRYISVAPATRLRSHLMKESEHPTITQYTEFSQLAVSPSNNNGNDVNDIILHSGGVGTNGVFLRCFLFCFSVIS